MDSKSYWKSREIKERERLLDAYIATTERMLGARYTETANRVIKEMEAMYDKIQAEKIDGSVLNSHLYSYNRYWEMLEQINKELTALSENEVKVLNTKMLNLYNENSKLIGKQYNLFNSLEADKARRTISTAWTQDGVNYSDRIWKHKDKLMNMLQQELVDSALAGLDTKDFVQKLMRVFKVSYNEASRLVRTELSRIYNQSAIDKYKANNINMVKWLTAPKCCEECKEIDGKKMQTEIADIPPLHPNCRCTIIPIIDKGGE